jgi:hypothetical protein
LADAAGFASEPAKIEIHPTLEQNDRNGEADEDREAGSETSGMDETEDIRPEEYPCRQQQDDSGHPEVPGKRLGEHPDGEGQGNAECGIEEGGL